MSQPDDDDVALLARLRHVLPAMHALVDQASGHDRGPTEATDATGTVQVRLDGGRQPTAVTVSADWRRAIGAEGFADAVTEAFRNAVFGSFEAAAAASGPARPDPERLMERIGSYVAYVNGDGPQPSDLPARMPRALPVEQDRDAFSSLADDMYAAVDATGGLSGALPAAEEPVGEGAQGRLMLTGALLVTCAADAEWVNRQDTADLNHALAAALGSLRARRDEASALWRRLVDAGSRLSGREAGRGT